MIPSGDIVVDCCGDSLVDGGSTFIYKQGQVGTIENCKDSSQGNSIHKDELRVLVCCLQRLVQVSRKP